MVEFVSAWVKGRSWSALVKSGSNVRPVTLNDKSPYATDRGKDINGRLERIYEIPVDTIMVLRHFIQDGSDGRNLATKDEFYKMGYDGQPKRLDYTIERKDTGDLANLMEKLTGRPYKRRK